MDLLFSLGLKRRRTLHEVSRGGLTAQVVEVAEGRERYYAILLLRGRSKEIFAELKMPEFEVTSQLIGNCWQFIRQLVGGDFVATLSEKDLPPS